VPFPFNGIFDLVIDQPHKYYTIMQKFSILLLLALIALACGGGEDAPSEAPAKKEVAAKEIDVKKIWKIRCIACHGLYGDMGTNGAANLQEVTSSLEYRVNIITNGSENGVMTAFGEILSEEEIEAMAKYTMSFNKDL
jgi:mono/diheme cytochrome c family protein